ncbi:MAG: pilus assembly FimT family protein [Acidobacteriaceae bacterium]
MMHPAQRLYGKARTRGFTLIELLVTLAIAAILAGVAVPQLFAAIQQRRAASVANTFLQDVDWVRQQAVAGSVSATLTLMPSCVWSVNTGSPADANHAMTPAQLAANSPGMSCGGVPVNGLVLSFNNLGMVSVPAGQTMNPNSTITFTSAQSSSDPTVLQVFGSGVVLEDPQSAS